MSRVSNAGFIGFSFQLDWNSSTPFDPAGIQIDTTISRNVVQLPDRQRDAIIDALTKEVREHIAARLVVQFPSKLREVMPGPGYAFDENTRKIREDELTFAEGGRKWLERHRQGDYYSLLRIVLNSDFII